MLLMQLKIKVYAFQRWPVSTTKSMRQKQNIQEYLLRFVHNEPIYTEEVHEICCQTECSCNVLSYLYISMLIFCTCY